MNTLTRHTLAAFAALLLLATAATAEGSRSKTFTVSKGGTLEVSTSVGDIVVRTSDKNEVAIKVSGIDDDELDRLSMTQEGGTVRVSYRARGRMWNGHVLFDISIPSQFNLDMTTSGGDLKVEGSLTGKIVGKTAGGDIKLGNVSGGPVDVTTSGGDIVAGDLQGDGELRTSGGNIKIGTVGGTLDVATSGGDIDVKSVGKSLDAKTAGGDIQVGDVGGEAKVSTSGGEIHVGKVSGKASLSTAGGDILLEGASGRVSAKTAGGDVRLTNITGSITASTAGGEVDAELVPSGKGDSKLSSAGGNVRLAVPENAKVTIEATIRVDGWGGKKFERYQVRSEFPQESYETDVNGGEIRAVYKLNGGGDVVTLKTVNADIELRKLRGK